MSSCKCTHTLACETFCLSLLPFRPTTSDISVQRMHYLQDIWDDILARYGTNPYLYRVLATYIFSTLLYFVYGSFYAIMDVTLSPQMLRKYKTQLGANEPIDWVKYNNMMRQVLFNNLVVSFVAGHVGYLVGLWVNGRESEDSIRRLPALSTILWQFPVLLLIREVPFYYSHVLLHHRLFYKRFHKMHHEWTAPVAFAATYAHPVEHIITNLFPMAVGPMLLKCHVTTSWIWYTYAIVYTITTHSGYHLPWTISSEYHDYHHLKFDLNYGTQVQLLDWLHGTDKRFWAPSGNGKRHRILWGAKSARELYPAESEEKMREIERDNKLE